MAMNAATAGVLAVWLGAERAAVERALSSFRGVERRMQFLGEVELGGLGGARGATRRVRVWDDYGHHPTEIDATLRALREHEFGDGGREGRLVCVFQPHQHSRTRFLLEEFAQSFSQADAVVVPEIYFVRDSAMERGKVSAADLVDRLRERGVRAMHAHPFGAIVDHLESSCGDGDVVVVMGAGPVWEVARSLGARGRSS
jgi:UDP-N-acetylmuramate--alanine ligase